MTYLPQLEEIVLIGHLFARLVDDMPEDECHSVLNNDPFNTSMSFSDDMDRADIAAVLAEAPSDDLLNLYKDLYAVQWEKPYADLAGNGWADGRLRLFMSHNNSDKVLVAKISGILEERYGIDGFVAHEDIEPLAHWQPEIEKALRESHACVAFLSEDFHASRWTDQELGWCIGRGIPIIPIRMGEDPYGFLGQYQALTKASLTDDQLAFQIFSLLRKDSRLDDALDFALVAQFVDSPGWVAASQRWKLVKSSVKKWPPMLRYMLEIAPARNSQVAGAHYGNMPSDILTFLSDLAD